MALSQATAKILLSLPYERKTSAWGPDLKDLRQRVLFEITGEKLPKAKCGATRVNLELLKASGIEAGKFCGAVQNDKIIEWLESL